MKPEIIVIALSFLALCAGMVTLFLRAFCKVKFAIRGASEGFVHSDDEVVGVFCALDSVDNYGGAVAAYHREALGESTFVFIYLHSHQRYVPCIRLADNARISQVARVWQERAGELVNTLVCGRIWEVGAL